MNNRQLYEEARFTVSVDIEDAQTGRKTRYGAEPATTSRGISAAEWRFWLGLILFFLIF